MYVMSEAPSIETFPLRVISLTPKGRIFAIIVGLFSLENWLRFCLAKLTGFLVIRVVHKAFFKLASAWKFWRGGVENFREAGRRAFQQLGRRFVRTQSELKISLLS